MNLSALQKCALLLFILITRAVSGAPLIKIADIPCACSQIQFSPINYQLEDAMKFQMVALIKLRLESHTLIYIVCVRNRRTDARGIMVIGRFGGDLTAATPWIVIMAIGSVSF
jgi:hypothetical protein